MHTLENISNSLIYRLLAGSLAMGLPTFLAACAGQPPRMRPATILDLDSLNREVEHKDSVESNVYFYEEAFVAYKAEFPGVDKPAYMEVARGKDQAFCLFQLMPAWTCVDVGDKFESLGLAEPARDAYQAGLLSEGVNGDSLNIRLWSGMALVHIGWQDQERAKPYLTKVLEVDPNNQWAKKLLTPLPLGASATIDMQKSASIPKPLAGRTAIRREAKEKRPKGGDLRNGKYGMSASVTSTQKASI